LYELTPSGGGIELFGVDPASGGVGTGSQAVNYPTLGVGNFNLSYPPGPMVPPSAKFLYVAGPGTGGQGIFGFSIAGTMGQLNPMSAFFPFKPSTPFNIVTGAGMSSQGNYIYVSDTDNVYTLPTTTIRAYAVDSTSGAITDGPILKRTSLTTQTFAGFEGTGKYLYAWSESPTGLSLSAFEINSPTGALTEVPGSPFFLIPNNDTDPYAFSPDPLHFATSPSGKFVYLSVLNFSAPSSPAPPSETISAFSVDATTGALKAVPGSPFQFANYKISSMTMHPNGRYLYLYVSEVGGSFKGELIYAIDQTLGTLSTSPVSTVADPQCCGPLVMDPSGAVLINVGGSSYRVDADSGLLTPSVGATPYNATGGIIVRIP
jgi:6-phosphogluconolactonase (cycloisomerase 2 family)